MSLLIDISIAAESIVNAAWARAAANRERLRLRQDLQAVREDTDRRLRRQPGWEDAFTNPLVTNYQPDEPVAVPLKREAGAVSPVGFVHLNSADATTGSIYVFSGDRQSYRLGTNTGGVAPQGSSLLLPISGSLAIFAAAFYESPSTPDGPYPYLHSNIFVVGVSTVRQLTRELPTSLRSFLDFAIDYAREAQQNGYTPIEQLSSYGNYNFGGPVANGGSPTCYQMIRDGFPFTGQTYDVSSVRAWSELDLSSVPSYDSADMGELFSTPGEVEIRLRRYPGLITTAMLENYEISQPVPPPYSFGAIVGVESPFWSGTRIIQAFHNYFNDFGVSSYCREQLLAMGFDEEDLEP